ncbi:MAG: hypothetical protein J6T74_01195 [Clostridia bacterium]|nr:hypothetical protein [Clostridia bacterium]
MSVVEKEIKIINLSGKRYDLIQKMKKATSENKARYEKEIERINKEIEELLDGKSNHC